MIVCLDIIYRPVFYLKQRFGDWILSPSSDKSLHKICLKQQDWTEHHLKEIQEIDPHVSDRSSDQTTSLDISPIWTSNVAAEIRKLQLRPM
jgi:hypothetical protein